MTIEAKTATTGARADTQAPIVVAVDGSERNRSAVVRAAEEAARQACEVVLVTALPDHVVSRPHYSAHTQGQEVLDMLADVRAEMRHLVDERAVASRALAGTPVEVLLDQASGARLVVVGKRGLGGFARLLVGSTSIALAGRSPVPVAIVPDGWDPAERSGMPVVLGVDSFRADHQASRLAFRHAERLGVPLVAVHGWETPAVFSWDADVISGAVREHDREGERRFDEFLATWTRRFPDVVVRPMRRHVHPATAILEAAEEAQLVVLGRHQPGVLGGFAYGSVARAVLHYADTPVLVVPSEDNPA